MSIQSEENTLSSSVGDHLAECRSMALVRVPFSKIRNLANLFKRLSVTCISATVHLQKFKPLALIQVTSLTVITTAIQKPLNLLHAITVNYIEPVRKGQRRVYKNSKLNFHTHP